MRKLEKDVALPLHRAERYFLEALVSDFYLARRKKGAILHLEFTKNNLAIWSNHCKDAVRRKTGLFDQQARQYQRKLDALLLDGTLSEYRFSGRGRFVFRYGSGGALPILRRGSEEFYCFFYRDIFPLGWNIANGGTDSRDELLNPAETIERELREELLVIDRKKRIRYVFEGGQVQSIDAPDFSALRQYWRQNFKDDDLHGYVDQPLPLKWLPGPDSMRVKIDDERGRVDNCFLNINALDFGIEVDRIARINLTEDAVIMDGEHSGNKLVNAPVGLFNVDCFSRRFQQGACEFIPDVLFYGGEEYPSTELVAVIGRYLKAMVIKGLRKRQSIELYQEAKAKYDLCPVTSRLLRRHLAGNQFHEHTHKKWKVFISYPQPDAELARQLYNYLEREVGGVFFAEKTAPNAFWTHAIDDALESADCLVVVATNISGLRQNWVSYEYRTFNTLMIFGKKERGQFISFLPEALKLDHLPPPLILHKLVNFNAENPSAAFGRLVRLVRS